VVGGDGEKEGGGGGVVEVEVVEVEVVEVEVEVEVEPPFFACSFFFFLGGTPAIGLFTNNPGIDGVLVVWMPIIGGGAAGAKGNVRGEGGHVTTSAKSSMSNPPCKLCGLPTPTPKSWLLMTLLSMSKSKLKSNSVGRNVFCALMFTSSLPNPSFWKSWKL